ncbi:MAG: energy-coupling factor transporter transmembrane protein EcfT [Synergistaceae bacterium]|jgi:cobalt/nickel transport system permease protein|nr:energy-coupling factor transporter transmembrane protein EcfT [Synergistaceae bacterium]
MIGSADAFEVCLPPSRLDAFDSRCRVVCALIAAVTIAALRGFENLAAGSMMPVMLLIMDWRTRGGFFSKSLVNINKISVFIWIFLPLTYPGEKLLGPFSREGLMNALIVTWKLNLISSVLLQMIVSLGINGLSDALTRLGCPRKLGMLLTLTMRYVILLSERMATAWRSVCVRSNSIGGGIGAVRVFACVVATTLIHSADRAERASIALARRGGTGGFSQRSASRWRERDSYMCALFLLNSLFIMLFPILIV